MPSPQEDYTYDQLVHYYGVAQLALRNFIEKYPGLNIEIWQSEQDTLSVLQSHVAEFGEQVIEQNSYLNEDEKDGIEIGTHVHYTNKTKKKKLFKRIAKRKESFESDLKELTYLHEIHLRGLYLELSMMSAKFSAERIQELHRRETWVETQRQHLINYYIRSCQKYSATKHVNLQFSDYLESLPESSGIYILFKEGEIIYIGHSANIKKRVKNHKLVQKSYRNSGPFEIECVYALLSRSKAQTIEKHLLQLVKPEFNKQSV
jgi:predicted GIY-YIG superfamily endonuclease